MRDVMRFLDGVAAWAAARGDVRAVGLAGSWARGAATSESDVDLILIVDDVAGWLAATDWMQPLGELSSQADEDWGIVQSRRATFRDGLAVEFGLTDPQWAALPLDAGTKQVIADGFRVLYDPDGLLSQAVDATGNGLGSAGRRRG